MVKIGRDVRHRFLLAPMNTKYKHVQKLCQASINAKKNETSDKVKNEAPHNNRNLTILQPGYYFCRRWKTRLLILLCYCSPGSTPASGRRRDSTDSVGEIATSMRRQVPDRGSASHSRNRADDVEFAAGRLQQWSAWTRRSPLFFLWTTYIQNSLFW